MLRPAPANVMTYLSPFSPLFYGIRDVTHSGFLALLCQPPFSPLFYGIRDVTPLMCATVPRFSAFSPLFYGIRDVTHPALDSSARSEKLSVPYFTGFVMLLEVTITRDTTVRLSVPYFTGFVMLPIVPTGLTGAGVRFQSPILRDS